MDGTAYGNGQRSGGPIPHQQKFPLGTMVTNDQTLFHLAADRPLFDRHLFYRIARGNCG
jgi:hypothetical protein